MKPCPKAMWNQTKTMACPKTPKRTTDEYDARLIVQTDFGWALMVEQQPKRVDLLWKRRDGVYRYTGAGWARITGKHRFIELKT